MRDFPSCFGENGVQVADFSSSLSLNVSKASHNTVTSIYVCNLFDKCCSVTVVWSKNLIGQCLSVEIEETSHEFISKFDVKPSLFFKRKGSKCLALNSGKNKVQVFWDLSSAKFGPGPEPVSSYYLAVACKCEVVLLIGDLAEAAFRKTGPTDRVSGSILVSRREHVFGKSIFGSKARFWDKGRIHDLKIECNTNCGQDPVLLVRVDTKTVMQVKRLKWKFRGNFVITVDGIPVEVFWDVHNWLFGLGVGSAVFMFRTGLLSGEKMWGGHSGGCESSDVDWRCSEDSESTGFGFSFFLYAWKNE